MNRILLLIMGILLTVIPNTACDTKTFNETLNPNLEVNVQVYQIKLPQFEGHEAIYCKDYTKNSNGIIIYEWWEDSGGIVWSPQKHSGQFQITGTYSIETVIASSLPKQ